MLFANTFFGRFIQPNHGRFTSSNASDFPKCGCKGNTFFIFHQIFLARITRINADYDIFFVLK